jgi:hypothetical protein
MSHTLARARAPPGSAEPLLMENTAVFCNEQSNTVAQHIRHAIHIECVETHKIVHNRRRL